MISPALLSSNMEHWLSPPGFMRIVEEAHGGRIDLDPATNRGSIVPASEHAFTGEADGLSIPWKGKVYVNPPYGTSITLWVARMMERAGGRRYCDLIALLPARTDAAWCQAIFDSADAWCFWRGRITFWRVWAPAEELEALTPKERRSTKLAAFIATLERMRDGQLPPSFRVNAHGLIVGPELNRTTCLPQPAPFPSLVPCWAEGDDLALFARVFRRKGPITIARGPLRGVYPRIAG